MTEDTLTLTIEEVLQCVNGGMTMYTHIDRAVKPEPKERLTLNKMRETMPPCPICGNKAYLMHDIVDGFDFGYSAGCPTYRLDDGVHGITEMNDPRAPRVDSYTARKCYDGWLKYCERMNKKEKVNGDSDLDYCSN